MGRIRQDQAPRCLALTATPLMSKPLGGAGHERGPLFVGSASTAAPVVVADRREGIAGRIACRLR